MLHQSDNSGYILRVRSPLVLSRSVQWTACLLLALAFLAPAQATNEPDLGEVDAVLAFLGDNAGAAQDTLGGLVPPADPAPNRHAVASPSRSAIP